MSEKDKLLCGGDHKLCPKHFRRDFLSSFWGLRPQTPTGALPLVPIYLYCLNCTTFGLVDSQENHKNCCHQMSDFKAKMHQIRFRLETPLGELLEGAKLASLCVGHFG